MSEPDNDSRLRHHDVRPTRETASLAEDVRRGLLEPPRALPPKYFYDDEGSQLFEAICDTPEYYPTRTEDALLAESAHAVIARVAPDHIIELGSGSSRKTRHLLAACDRQGIKTRYWPFEVSTQIMLDSARDLLATYPWLEVEAMTGDYTGGLANLPLAADGGRRLFVFLGGTIGNFEPAAGEALLAEIRALMNPGDALLLGMDRVKDPDVLEAAYDDAAGHTARFNRNVLTVLNRELGGDFPIAAYRHQSVFNAEASRIEMWLIATAAHRVSFKALDAGFEMTAGEGIRTEISRKFSPASIQQLLDRAGLSAQDHFEAEGGAYSLVLAAEA
ncbi:L-histidine N(alpha)-methyltransferase [Salinisphaera sp. Q1T1-3]|uniref:L-histidine N(alpha)-methyltransferase n=1 Tax=Salinisphaera sp. Q1T1-3 TaxID=2321229 RepID=UPI000E762DCA|nr:L-histidine N(alpha)-methyltransferase [Salinisphaera sp. Q1T1-3]RJS93832.1 L-histidine N(alpha)-methyltransferase [Salinisphaera sp. Q1T1-3]